MLAFYHDSDSIMSFKVRSCLAEKGREWQGHRIVLDKFENLTPEYLLFDFLWEGKPGIQGWIQRIKNRKNYHQAKPKQRLPVPEQADVDLCTRTVRDA